MKLEETIKTEYANVNKTTLQNAKTESSEYLQIFFSLYKKIMLELNSTGSFWTSNDMIDNCIQRGLKKWTDIETKVEPERMYTKEDIEKFSFQLAEIQNNFPNNYQGTQFSNYTGLFLSALINIHHAKTKTTNEYIIHTMQFDSPLNNLCYKNTANVRVIGNVGDYFCVEMIFGNVHLEGNSGDYACANMIDGTVQIDGNAAKNICTQMKEGNVTVKGSTEGCPAHTMYGGNLHIYGNSAGVCTRMEGGTVTVEGNDTNSCAFRMSGGKLLIKGNVGNYPAFGAHDCYIHIQGNAGDDVGTEMTNGVLRIDGNVGINVGSRLNGGNIYLNGDYESIAQNTHKGRIYVREKQVFPYMEDDLFSQIYHHMFKW